jgi:hypothetical protein
MEADVTTIQDTVAAALSEEPVNRAAIAEATGLELQSISNALNALARLGLAVRAGGGCWIAGDAAPASTRRHEAAEPATEPASDKPVRRRGRQKASAAPSTMPPPKLNGRTLEFALSETGEILMRARSSSAEWRTMPRADAEALAGLLERSAT